MTDIELMYFNDREGLIDDICALEEEIAFNLPDGANPESEESVAEHFPLFAEFIQNLTWNNPVHVGRKNMNLQLTPCSSEAMKLLEKEIN